MIAEARAPRNAPPWCEEWTVWVSACGRPACPHADTHPNPKHGFTGIPFVVRALLCPGPWTGPISDSNEFRLAPSGPGTAPEPTVPST